MNFRFHPFPICMLITVLLLAAGCDEQPTGPDDSEPETYNHELTPGVANEDLITAADFDRLVVEIQYMGEHAPDPEAVSSLEEFFETWLEKSDVEILSPSQIPSGGQQNYTASQVRQLEEEHRTEFSNPQSGRLAAYVLILDGEFDEREVLGIAYYNTSSALFGETIERISNGIGRAERHHVEATVLRHEFGHLMGLVDAGTDMQEDHHDEPNGAHCDREECLMYYAYEHPDLFQSIFGQEVPDLDSYCQADIEALKDG